MGGGKSTAATSTGSYSGGNVYIDVGGSTNGAASDAGAVYLRQSDGTAIVTASATTFTATSTAVSITATSTLAVSSGSTLTITSSSGVSLSKMTGKITSYTSALAAGSSDTITLTNSRITTSSLVFVTVHSGCTGGYVVVVEALAASGTASLVMYNAGSSACSSTYAVHFMVVNNS